MSKAKDKLKRWHLRSGDINEFAHAPEQFSAYDTLRDREAETFGLIVVAEPDESADPFLVRTSLLMCRWGRLDDAKRFIARGIEVGMPDTTREDMEAAQP